MSPSTDDNLDKATSKSSAAPPRVKIERKMFPEFHESYLSTSNSDDAIEKPTVITEQAQVYTRPKSPPLRPATPTSPPPNESVTVPRTAPPVAVKPNGLITNGIAIRRVDGKPQQPPSPPLHRIPSWEKDIYDVAEKGVKLIRQKSIDNPQYDIEGKLPKKMFTLDRGGRGVIILVGRPLHEFCLAMRAQLNYFICLNIT